MDQCSNQTMYVHLVLGIFGAMNVALGTWLAHKRRMADRREHKRNGSAVAQQASTPESFEPSERVASTRDDAPKR